MRMAIRAVRPDAVVHLGDYYDDGEEMASEFPQVVFHLVGGNCDRFRSYRVIPERLCYPVCGAKLLMVHGHNHHVKSGLWSLLEDARASGVQAVLYGHTHSADCHREEDGLWVLNPGACGSSGGSVGVVEVLNGEISSCCVLYAQDLRILSQSTCQK
ncbi:MAG: metallophosphoesterase family protein [Firmicutes bacterium]|nr:metallophosphoesterase family protein [Bacillota bacterium]